MKINLNSNRQHRGRREFGFTLVEIALCIGIVAIAMVAIMGVLPTGLQVQRENREDTIINQDGTFLLEAVRSSLTNASVLSSNLVWIEVLTNGTQAAYFTNLGPREVVGLLSYPRYTAGGARTNVVRARFRSKTGSLAEQAAAAQDVAFSYLVTTEVVPFDPTPGANPAFSSNLYTNLYELRLTLRWPVLPDQSTGAGRQVFRALVSGELQYDAANDLYFFQPSTFISAN